MNCEKFNFGSGTAAIICGRGGPRCYRAGCRGGSEFQCDFPVGEYKSGKRKGQTRTCDRHCCSRHVGHGVTPNVDFCLEHFPIAKRAHERRMTKKANDLLYG